MPGRVLGLGCGGFPQGLKQQGKRRVGGHVRAHRQADGSPGFAGIEWQRDECALRKLVGDDAGRYDPHGVALPHEGAAERIRHGFDGRLGGEMP